MGMFDYVNFECECPICGEKVIGFQTKEGPLLLETLEPLDVNNFYSNCSTCGAWIEFYDTDNFSKKGNKPKSINDYYVKVNNFFYNYDLAVEHFKNQKK